jgi:protein-L-isoaspartate(D-aspartate) O-methyltransferase
MKRLEELLKKAQELKITITKEILNHLEEYKYEREKMIELFISRGIKDQRVILAMLLVPRHIFIPKNLQHLAYEDKPLPIGFGQTISQPYIIALMTENLELKGEERVLEVGTGSGYHTAVLSLLSKEVVTIEFISSLSDSAKEKISLLGLNNVRFVVGDGSCGVEFLAPYDRICVSAASPSVPEPLIDQLKDNGIMLIPIGDEEEQILSKIIKVGNGKGYEKQEICPCKFVKLKGKYGFG